MGKLFLKEEAVCFEALSGYFKQSESSYPIWPKTLFGLGAVSFLKVPAG